MLLVTPVNLVATVANLCSKIKPIKHGLHSPEKRTNSKQIENICVSGQRLCRVL